MSTLLHVANADFDLAMAEMVRADAPEVRLSGTEVDVAGQKELHCPWVVPRTPQ